MIKYCGIRHSIFLMVMTAVFFIFLLTIFAKKGKMGEYFVF